MANPFKMIKDAAFGTTVGKVTAVSTALVVSGVSYKLYHDERTGDVVGAERVEKTVAKNDAQSDVRLKMEGLKDTPKDAEAEKAAAEAAAKAAEEAAKAKEAEDAKLEEALKAQREAEEAAALAEQQAQEQNGENPDDEQNPDDVKDENADEGDGESDAEAGEDEKGPDTYKGGDENDDMKVDENGNPIDTEKTDGTEGGEETEGENEDKEQQLDEDGNPIKKGTQEGVDPNDPNNTGMQPGGETQEDENKKGKVLDDGKQETNENGDVIEEGKKESEENENEEQRQDDNKNEEEGNENKEEQNLEQKEKIEKEGTPTEVNDNNINANNNQNVNTTGSGNDNLNSFRNGNFGTNATMTVSPAEIMRKAQEKWGKLFEDASFQKGRISMNESDIELVGYDPGNSGWTRVETGLDWAIRAAADRKASSTVSVLTFVLGSKRKDEICKGIGLGIKAVCERGELPFDTFEIHVKGPELNPNDIEIIRKSASMSFEDMWARYKLEVSLNRAHEGIIQIRAKDDPKVLKNNLLDRFRSSSSVTVTARDLGMSQDRLFGFGYDGESAIAWAIREAASGNGSKVNVLTLDISWLRNNSEAQGQVLNAVQSLLYQAPNPLRNGVFTVSGTFFNGTLFKGCNTGPGILEFQCLQDGVRLLPLWANDLKKKFAAGNGYVSDAAVNALGIKTVLELAANEKNLKQLWLYFGKDKDARLKELAQALADVACRKDIENTGLKIRINAEPEEMEELEDDTIRRLGANTPEYLPLFDDECREISFGKCTNDGIPLPAIRRQIVNNWNDTKEALVLNYFANDGKDKDITWEDVFNNVKEFEGPSARQQYEQVEYPRYRTIYIAAHPKSKIKSLDLTTRNSDGTECESRPSFISLYILAALRDNSNLHGFTLKVKNAEKVWEFIKGTRWYKEIYNDKIGFDGTNLQFIGNAGTTTTTTPKKATGAPIAIDEAKLEAIEEEFETTASAEFESVAGQYLGGLYQHGLPVIYAYDFINDCEDGLNGKKAGDVKFDSVLITGVADPKEAGLGENDLVLKATCFYHEGLYADRRQKDGDKIAETRNYYTHTWLKDCTKKEGERDVLVRTSIVRPRGGLAPVSAFGELSSVMIHDPAALEIFLSPNNNVFKIANGASAWFISEFDPTDEAYNPSDPARREALCFNPKQVEFLGVTGKRTIAIHWTFVKADDMMRDYDAAKANAEANGTYKLPFQFSPNANERSMDSVNAYLKRKKEGGDPARRLLEALAKYEDCYLSDEYFKDAHMTFLDFLRKTKDCGTIIKKLEVDFEAASNNAIFLRAWIEGACFDNDTKLESITCDNEAFYKELKALAKQIKNNPKAVFDLDCNDAAQSLTFNKRGKEDEETKKRHLLFDLKQMLSKAEKGSTIAAKDMVPYLEGLGLQKVLEAIFNGSNKRLIVKIPFDPYLKDKKDEWVAAFREICSRDKDISPLGNNQVRLEDYDVNDKLRSVVVREVNACASVKQFLRTFKKDASFRSGGSDTIAGKRKEEAAKHAEDNKDYPNQIPLAILTALGEFGRFKKIGDGTIDKAVERLNQRILKENERERFGRSFAAGTFRNNKAIWTEDETLWRAPAALGYSIVLVKGDKLTFYPSFEKDFDVAGFKDIDIAKAKEVLPKSLAERMLWIKKTTEKKEGEEDKVTYAVDFDTAAGFGDAPLEFDDWVEHKDEKNNGIGTFCKPLNAKAESLMYLRYSLDPKAFLRAFLSEDLEDLKVTECKLSLLGIVKAEASFFDALQAMCSEKNWSSEYEISIGYGSADNSKDAEIQKLVNDRFDPWADTYVVYKGKGKFRYANHDELERFWDFKDDNPFHENSTFNDIEKTKRKWFEQEEQRIREEAEEVERKKQEEEEEKAEAERQKQVDKFDAGGDIKVDQAFIGALAEKGIIAVDDKGNYSVLSVIQKAAEKDSNVEQLTVEFNTTDQFEKALDILVNAFKTSKKKLKLQVSYIRDAVEECNRGKYQGYLLQKEVNGKKEHEDCTEYIVRSKYHLGGGNYVSSKEGNIIWVSKVGGSNMEAKEQEAEEFDEEEEAKRLEKEAEELEAKEKAWKDGDLSKLLKFDGVTLEGVFEKAGADEKSLNVKDVDVVELGNTLVKWFSKDENRGNDHHWFLTLDKDSEAIWKQMEKVAEAVNKLNERFLAKANKIFMHLDRENEKIFFNEKSLSQDDTGILVWDWYALSFLPPAETKDLGEEDKKEWIEKFGEFARAVAENEAITCIDFDVSEDVEGAEKIWAVTGKEEFWQALKEELNSRKGFEFLCPWIVQSWLNWNDKSFEWDDIKKIFDKIGWTIRKFDENDKVIAEDDDGISSIGVIVPEEPASQNDKAEDKEQGEDDDKGDDGGEGGGNEGEQGEDNTGVPFADVLTETGAQDVWNACLDELKAQIPNYENEGSHFENDHIKPVFSDLVSLYGGNVGDKCRERIANPDEVKEFLLSIKEWSPVLSSDTDWYVIGEKTEHQGIHSVKKIMALSLWRWSQYQRWRFGAYFIAGFDMLPDSETDPKKAYEQMEVPIPEYKLFDPD